MTQQSSKGSYWVKYFPDPPADLKGPAEEMDWSAEVLAGIINPGNVADITNNYHRQADHISALVLLNWLDGEESDEFVKDHIERLGDHYQTCKNCNETLMSYYQRKGYSLNIGAAK